MKKIVRAVLAVSLLASFPVSTLYFLYFCFFNFHQNLEALSIYLLGILCIKFGFSIFISFGNIKLEKLPHKATYIHTHRLFKKNFLDSGNLRTY